MPKLLANKKILFACIGTIIIITIAIIIIVLNNKYVIKVYKVDDRSTDRVFKVYNKLNKKVNYLEIRLKDNTYLCSSKNPTVYYGDILDVDELKIIVSDNKTVIAKVIEE